jgi:hypothetical protein
MAALDLGTAEADGAATGTTAASFTLSPLQISYNGNPFGVGANSLYALLAGTLHMIAEADGSAQAAATMLIGAGLVGESDGAASGAAAVAITLSNLNISGQATGYSSDVARLAGTLEVSGESDTAAGGSASMSGGGTPTAIQAASTAAGSQPLATIRAANAIAPTESDGAGSATGTMGIGIGRANAAGSASTSAALRLQIGIAAHAACASQPAASLSDASDPISPGIAGGLSKPSGAMSLRSAIASTAEAGRSQAAGHLAGQEAIRASSQGAIATAADLAPDAGLYGDIPGQADTGATISAVASISGRSGPDGWQAPQIQGHTAGSCTTWASLSVQGQPSVFLTGAG